MLPSTRPPRPLLHKLTAVWLGMTSIHITIWLMIATIGGHVDRPWWLWASLPTGLALWAAWWLSVPDRLAQADQDD
jgi:hypothetical protein